LEYFTFVQRLRTNNENKTKVTTNMSAINKYKLPVPKVILRRY